MEATIDVGRLPDDLLHELFSILISESPDFASIISATCRHWRGLAVGRSHYWSRLVLDGTKAKSLFVLRDKEALWSSRCVQGPKETTLIYGSRHFLVLPLLSYVSYPQRKITFHGENPHEFIVRLNPNMPPNDDVEETTGTFQPAISSLFPLSKVVKDLVWDLEERPLVKLSFGGEDQSILYTNPNLLSPTHHPFGHIRRLILPALPFSVVTECKETVELLSAFPLLESLQIGSAARSRRPVRECLSLPPLPLPKLRFLHVRRCPYFNCLLTHLQIPDLKQLVVFGECSLDSPSSPDHTSGTAAPQLPVQTAEPPPPTLVPGIRDTPSHYPWPTTITSLQLLHSKLQQADYLWIFKNLRQLDQLVLQSTTEDIISLLCPAENWEPLPVLRYLEINFATVCGSTLIRMINSRKASERVSGPEILELTGSQVTVDERAVLEGLVNLVLVDL